MDLNHQPRAYESPALPLSYLAGGALPSVPATRIITRRAEASMVSAHSQSGETGRAGVALTSNLFLRFPKRR